MLKFALIVLLILGPCQASLDEVASLQALSDTYHFVRPWQQDVFDCADMSSANWAFLQEHGYESKIAIVDDAPNGYHCIALARLSGGWVGLDTRQRTLENRSLEGCVGKVVSVQNISQIFDRLEDLAAFDRSMKEGLRGPYLQNVIEPNPIGPSVQPLSDQ